MAYKPLRDLGFRFLTTSASTLSPKPTTNSSSSFAVQFLINSCGLPLQSALSASEKLRLKQNHLKKPESVLHYLRSHGFSDTQITELIQKWPKVLHCKLESNLKPKFDFFISHGFVGNLLPELMLSRPMIFQRDLHSHLKWSFEFLKSLLGSEEKIVENVRRSPWLLLHDFKASQPNIDFLLKQGVPWERIAKFICLNIRTAMQKHDKLVFAVNAVKDLGIQPEEPMFVHGVKVMLFMSPSIWKEKVEVMKSMGWTEKEIVHAFSRSPYFMSRSEEKIRRAMYFYMNTVKLERHQVVSNPVLLSFSIDKRVGPRLNVLKVLQSKNLVSESKKIMGLLQMSEKKFLKDYITKFDDKIPGLLEIYHQGKKV